METETILEGDAITVTVAFAVFVVSETDVAVRVIVAGFGTLPGAAYVTEVVATFVSVPHPVPLQPVPVKAHVTPLFWLSFRTVAVNGDVWLT
jgi:hypothetical protein